jgi:hypothetical protein
MSAKLRMRRAGLFYLGTLVGSGAHSKAVGHTKTGGFAFVPDQYRWGSASTGVVEPRCESPQVVAATKGRPVRLEKHTPAISALKRRFCDNGTKLLLARRLPPPWTIEDSTMLASSEGQRRDKNWRMSISRMSRDDDQRPSCSARMRRGGSRRILRNSYKRLEVSNGQPTNQLSKEKRNRQRRMQKQKVAPPATRERCARSLHARSFCVGTQTKSAA